MGQRMTVIWVRMDEVAGSSGSQVTQEENTGGKRSRIRKSNGRRKRRKKEESMEWNMFQRQDHGGDKLKNWSLQPKRPIFILGDSNMARLPTVWGQGVQANNFERKRI